MMEMVKIVQQMTDKSVPYIIGPRRDGDVQAAYADTHKAQQIL